MAIQTGIVHLGYKASSGWNLSSGQGERSFTSPDIKFPTAFTNPPQVAVSLCGLDSDAAKNLRVTVEAADIEKEEFNIVVRTWADSILYGVWVTWIADE